MKVVFDPVTLFGQVDVRQYYASLIPLIASQIIAPEYIDNVEAVVITQDFVSSVTKFQKDCGMETSVTNNEHARAYGKMIQKPQSQMYYVFLDAFIASYIMEDNVFQSCFSNCDDGGYQMAVQHRQRALNIFAHELSHVELSCRVKSPEIAHSLKGSIAYQAYILFDEYFACRKAAIYSKSAHTNEDEGFIIELENQIVVECLKYKERESSLNQFCHTFHAFTEMTLIRLVSTLGAYHANNISLLPFPNTQIGKYAQVFCDNFKKLYTAVLECNTLNIPDEIVKAIYDYFTDVGVKITADGRGLYYNIII